MALYKDMIFQNMDSKDRVIYEKCGELFNKIATKWNGLMEVDYNDDDFIKFKKLKNYLVAKYGESILSSTQSNFKQNYYDASNYQNSRSKNKSKGYGNRSRKNKY